MRNRNHSHVEASLNPPTASEVQEFYEHLPEIEPETDRWVRAQSRWIRKFIETELLAKGAPPPRSCLNLGSGALSYGIPEDALVHVDLDRSRFAPEQHVIVANIQNLPPNVRGFQSCLCVGSVLNHCDAARVIAEAGAAVQAGGLLILEFDTSASLALIMTRHFNQSASIVHTFYQNRTIKLWVYSEQYIRGILAAHGFEVCRRSTCHHLSPLLYRLCRSSNVAARLHMLDGVARAVPGLRDCASNAIYACRKLAGS